MTGTVTCLTISGTARAAASVLTVTRTSSLPAACRALTWPTVARTVQPLDLAHRGRHVGGIGVGHGLHDDGAASANLDPAHVDRDRLAPFRGIQIARGSVARPPG